MEKIWGISLKTEPAISTRLLSVTYFPPRPRPVLTAWLVLSKALTCLDGSKRQRTVSLCEAPRLLLCPLFHLPACQETADLSAQRRTKVSAGPGCVLGQGSHINECAQPGTRFCLLHILDLADWPVKILHPSVLPSDDLFI